MDIHRQEQMDRELPSVQNHGQPQEEGERMTPAEWTRVEKEVMAYQERALRKAPVSYATNERRKRALLLLLQDIETFK
jgi:hypothetical protein